MNCERFQELILTDYLDGMLNETAKQQLEGHLKECPQCQEFAQTAMKTAVNVFNNVPRKQVPENVWEKIEDALIQEAQPKGGFSWLGLFKNIFLNPRPAMAIMAVFVVIMVIGTVNPIKVQQASVNDQSIEYLVSLINPNSDITTSDSEDFGTAVEQYFL